MRPLLRCLARPMKEEWKMRPYFGVLPRVFSALQQKAWMLANCQTAWDAFAVADMCPIGIAWQECHELQGSLRLQP